MLAPMLFACQKMVEKEHMDAIGNYATAMCKCAEISDVSEAKSCADALKKPTLVTVNESGRPIYKLESLHSYDDVDAIAFECQKKVMSR